MSDSSPTLTSQTQALSASDLAPTVRTLKPSATLAINERSAELIASGQHVYRLGLGQSPFPVPPHVVYSLAEHAAEKDYLPVKGLRSLRHAIVDWITRTEGITRHSDHVIIGPGSKELIFITQLAYDGQLVLPAPSWVSYAPQAELIGRDVRWVNTSLERGLKIDPEALEALCLTDPTQRRLLILNTPCNPTGACYHEDELQALTEVLRRYRILVISDEIYSGTHYSDAHVSLARYYPEGTIISNGISKWAGAGGWRLGFMSFPENLSWLVNAMAGVASETFTSVSAPIQYAAVKAFEDHPEMTQYLAHCRMILCGLATYAFDQLSAAGAVLNPAEGGFYLFPSFEPLRAHLEARGVMCGADLARALLDETGVATLSGDHFGRPAAELSLRIALVDFDGESTLQALANTHVHDQVSVDFYHTHCHRVMQAIDLIAAWVR